MPSPFIEAPVITNETALKELARTKLTELVEASGVLGYEAKPASLEVIILEVAAALFASTAQTSAVVLNAIFRAYGTQLLGIPFNEGSSATVSSTWTVAESAGVRQIEQGLQVEAGGIGFYVEAETEVPAKATSVTVHLVAINRGEEGNKVSGVAQQLNPLSWVLEVALIGESANGTNQESDSEYLIRLARQLQLQAPRPVNAADFAPFMLGMPSSVLPSGLIPQRALSIDLYDAETSEENVANCDTTWVTKANGEAFTTKELEEMQAWLRKYVPQNFLAFVRSPAYEAIYVTAVVHVLAAYTSAAVVANVKVAIEHFLSPAVFGNPSAATVGSQEWEYEPKVRYNAVLEVAGSVPGVAYVLSGSSGLKIGTAPSPAGTSDITLSGGKVVLPEAVGSHVLVTAA
jgi:hypothetical protein